MEKGGRTRGDRLLGVRIRCQRDIGGGESLERTVLGLTENKRRDEVEYETVVFICRNLRGCAGNCCSDTCRFRDSGFGVVGGLRIRAVGGRRS
jgi:hypothetical protein